MTPPRSACRALAVALLASGLARAATNDGRLGSRCAKDGDCAQGLSCIPPDGGGPAGGLCTLPCVTAADCQPYGEASYCLGICYETCESNVPRSTALDPGKCHGRDELGCLLYSCADAACSTTSSICQPLCATDLQCGKGLFCDRASGACVSSRPSGTDPPGAECELGAEVNTCAGTCIPQGSASDSTPQSGLCTERCVIGAEHACGAPEGKRAAACLSVTYGVGAGDVGQCVSLCNCQSDCPGKQHCQPWNLGDSYDFAGICASAPALTAAPDCLNGTGGEAGAPTAGCAYGPVRACSLDGCLGTAECLPDGTYAACRCSDTAAQAGAPPLATPPNPGRGCSVHPPAPAPATTSLVWPLAALLVATHFRRSSRRPFASKK